MMVDGLENTANRQQENKGQPHGLDKKRYGNEKIL